jgi:hypothetical protein
MPALVAVLYATYTVRISIFVLIWQQRFYLVYIITRILHTACILRASRTQCVYFAYKRLSQACREYIVQRLLNCRAASRTYCTRIICYCL